MFSHLSFRRFSSRFPVMLLCITAATAALVPVPRQAAAADGTKLEYSLGFSFNRTQYDGGSFNWERRWGTSIGYNFSDTSQLEASIQDVFSRNKFAGFEDDTYHDQIYSADWVQGLVGKEYRIQPYVKAGIGQLIRKASATNSNGITKSSSIGQLTGVLGAGLRLYITRTFAIKAEATSYLTGGSIATYKNNLAGTIGVSLNFD
ncbi:MAG: outer membrane beta-barrel protein [Methylotenera sp.]|nr:outer membrane beta-barrel protein [Oligoflexia bacterium]